MHNYFTQTLHKKEKGVFMFKKENLTIPNILTICRVIFIPLLLFQVHNEMRLGFMITYVLVASYRLF